MSTDFSPSSEKSSETVADLRQAALAYHEYPRPGKLAISATKPLTNQRDLALAYSPGVAAACEAIAENPATASQYTARGNLVAVVSNGTAVLGLGDIGPLASKPVMEGKAVLFKTFAGIDVFDIELAEKDTDRLVELIAALEPTFGGINLEDIKAPECFEIERRLRERMKIPVFHDDQHGTAIIVGAAVRNGLSCVDKKIGDVKLVVSGAGAAALACVDLLLALGLSRENVWIADREGVVYEGRPGLKDPNRLRFAQKTDARTLSDAMVGADIFLGLSVGGIVSRDMVAAMADRPLILALSNPTPEILPEEVAATRSDAIVATGRTDYPNQVNNVLCFPFIFRGALDVGATTITPEMEIAAVDAIADLARMEQDDRVASAYGIEALSFGPQYLIPKPFDPRLIVHIAPAVAKAAMDSGVATRPIESFDRYRDELREFVYRSSSIMKPVFTAARQVPEERSRILFAEGEEERVLRAAQVIVDEEIARPILIGRRSIIEYRLQQYGLRLGANAQIDIVDTDSDSRYRPYWLEYRALMGRRGVTEQYARLEMRRRNTLIGAMLLKHGEADGLICGTISSVVPPLHYIDQILGRRKGRSIYAGMNALLLPDRQLFLVDTEFNEDPTAEQLAEITLMAADGVRRFGIVPKVALLSHSNFGSSDSRSALKMRQVLQLLHEQAPELEVEGEINGECALDEGKRRFVLPETTLSGSANLLVFPSLDASNIAYNLLKVAAGNGIAIGPMLLGCAAPVSILNPTATVRRIVNMTALTVADSVKAG